MENKQNAENMDMFSMFGMEMPKVNKKEDKKEKGKPSQGNVPKAPKKEPEMINQLLKVRVYGQELIAQEFSGEKALVLDDIRELLCTQYGYTELTKEDTEMHYNKETGVVVPIVGFKKKG